MSASFSKPAIETVRIWLTPTIEADLRHRRIFPALRLAHGGRP